MFRWKLISTKLKKSSLKPHNLRTLEITLNKPILSLDLYVSALKQNIERYNK